MGEKMVKTDFTNVSIIPFMLPQIQNKSEHVFMIDSDSGKTYTFKDLYNTSVPFAKSLQNFGLNTGDLISIASGNDFNGICALIGCWLGGFTSNAFNSDVTKDDIRTMLKISKPKLVYCGKNIEIIKSVIEEYENPIPIITPNGEASLEKFSDWTKADISDFNINIPDYKNHVWCTMFTSGTTGIPKLIKLKDNFLDKFSDRKITNVHGLFLLTSPMFWVSNFSVILSSLLTSASILTVKSDFTLNDLVNAIEIYKPMIWFTGPSTLLNLCEMNGIKDRDLSSLKYVSCGGSYVAVDKKRQINELVFNNKIKLMSLYASTECGLIATTTPDIDSESEKYNSVGRPVGGVSVKVINENGESVLGIREKGELCIKSGSLMYGMVTGNGEFSKGVDEDGWFHTGDIGYFDEDGYLYIAGRIKEIFKYKNIQIAPAEIEMIINQHPDVIESSVLGKPDTKDGELPCAFVVRKKESNLTESELDSFVSEHVADYKRLRGGIYFLESLPKTQTGKILRKDLEKLLKV